MTQKQLPAAIRQKSYYMVLESLKTVLQIVEIFHLTLNQLFSKQKQYTEKKIQKQKSPGLHDSYMIGCEDKKQKKQQKYPTQTPIYIIQFSYIPFTHLCPVKLSQKVIVPSVPQVITQVWGTPFAFVPTHTKASNPNPRRRLHRRLA